MVIRWGGDLIDESVKVAIKREQRQVYLAMPSESNFMSEANNRLIGI